MKKSYKSFDLLILALFISCNTGNKLDEHRQKQFPKPGATVAEGSMPVTGDALNHFTFSVKVIADSQVTSGVYDVDADYGPNFGEGKFSMPKGIEDIKPEIRKGSSPYSYIIGFRIPGDTTFNDYFEVRCTKTSTKMEYIKAYSF